MVSFLDCSSAFIVVVLAWPLHPGWFGAGPSLVGSRVVNWADVLPPNFFRAPFRLFKSVIRANVVLHFRLSWDPH